MTARYYFFFMLGLLHFSFMNKSSMPNNSIVLDATNTPPKISPSPATPTKNRLSMLSSSKLDKERLLQQAMNTNVTVQRSWISSMIIPGLGQIYNKDYWKVPCLYAGFALLGYKIYSDHQKMNGHKRTLLYKTSQPHQPTKSFTTNGVKDCERSRDMFIIIGSVWYLLNIFDAYAGAHNKTINFTNNIDTTLTPE